MVEILHVSGRFAVNRVARYFRDGGSETSWVVYTLSARVQQTAGFPLSSVYMCLMKTLGHGESFPPRRPLECAGSSRQ